MSQTQPKEQRSSANSAQIRRWRSYLADERAEANVYRNLGARRTGEEQAILYGLAEAEKRHEQHWLDLLGDRAYPAPRASIRARLLGFLAKHLGSVFVLAMAQRAEGRSPYSTDADATPAMAADEQIHEEVVRGLATRGRNRLSGSFRAAVFGANDGLVSNLSLLMGLAGAGATGPVMLLTGIAGLLSGALSMGAGEYVSVRSQRELLSASKPTQVTLQAAKVLDIDANELELVYRARGMDEEQARHRAQERMGEVSCDCEPGFSLQPDQESDEHETLGTAWGAAFASFCFFASGAIIPVLPYIFGASGLVAIVISVVLVGLALMLTGAIVGLLSGVGPLWRALRQLMIGFGAAIVTYVLGLLFGAVAG